MLSRVNELRFNVLDLSELKERRLGVVAVEVTDYQDNSHNDGEGRLRRRVDVKGGRGYESEQEKNKQTTNINTLNACSFQEPECMPPTTITRQERECLRGDSSGSKTKPRAGKKSFTKAIKCLRYKVY